MPVRRPAAAVALLVGALLLAGCAGPPVPEEALADAFERTFSGAFAFDATVDADRGALAALGENAGQAAAFLSGFRIQGRTDGTRHALTVRILGTDLLDFRALSPEERYLRLGLSDLAAVADIRIGHERALRLTQDLDLPASVTAAVVAALEGRWVAVVGRFSGEDLAQLAGPGVGQAELAGAVRAAFGEDVGAFLERFVAVDAQQEEAGGRRFVVSLRLRELLRAAAELQAALTGRGPPSRALEVELAGLPETVAGTVTARDGQVHELRFDVTAGRVADGSVELTVRLSDHGAVQPVTAPEGAVRVPGRDLATGLERLARLTGGLVR